MLLLGNWTATVGDAHGTITIARVGKIFAADFIDITREDSGPVEAKVPVTTSISNGTATITVHHSNTVTGGRFRIEYL